MAHDLQTVLTPAQDTVVAHLGVPCSLLMTCWLPRASSFASMFHARAWNGACAPMERATHDTLKLQEPALSHKGFKSYEH
jgi:hypothetical protein